MIYTIKGIEYNLAFNFNTIRNFCKKVGLKTISEFDAMMQDADDLSIETIENRMQLMLCGFEEGERLQGQKFRLTLDDLFAALSDNPSMIIEIMQLFAESQPKPTDGGGDDGKKKV
jgi:hypothetical protein